MNSRDKFLETMHAWMYEMMRHSMHGFMQYAKKSGISMSQITAMIKLNKNSVCGVTDLGDELGISSAAASQLLDRMVQQGSVERTEDPADRRSKRLVLTDEGRKTLKETMNARQEWVRALASSLNEEELNQVAETLAILVGKSKTLITASNADGLDAKGSCIS
jgi:DNA-binding MarR family transcriptional regulator